MGTTADKLNKLVDTKAAIKTAIESKGQTVGDIPFSQYPDKINAIESGGGGGTIEDYLTSVGREYMINDILYVLTRSVEMQDKTKTMYYLVSDNNAGGAVFIDGVLPPNANQAVNYQKPIMSVRNVDFSNWVYTSNSGRCFAYNGNLVEFMGVSTAASGEGVTDFSGVTQANMMFAGCASLRDLKVYLPAAITVESMFSDDPKIETVAVKGVTATVNTSYMFNKCVALREVDFGEGITSNNVRGMFMGCTRLVSVKGVIDITGVSNLGQFLDGQGAKIIRDIKIKGLSDSITIVSTKITKESLLYLFENAQVTTDNKNVWISHSAYELLTEEEMNIIRNKGWQLLRGAT